MTIRMDRHSLLGSSKHMRLQIFNIYDKWTFPGMKNSAEDLSIPLFLKQE